MAARATASRARTWVESVGTATLACGMGVGVAGGGITVGVGVGPPAPTVVMTGGPGMGGVVSLSIV